MLRRHKNLTAAIAAAGTLLGLLALVPATTAAAAPAWKTHVCHGTLKRPGHLTGVRNLNEIIVGVCLVDRGPAAVERNVIVTRHSALIAAFGRRHSRLTVGQNIFVHKGGTLILGCEAKHFACVDDPHPKKPTLNSRSVVGGSLMATAALGVVVHDSHFGRGVFQTGGGGGLNCKPTGVFAQFQSPVFSDYEDNWIGGSVLVRGLRSCFFGELRNWIGHSGKFSHNKMADPDAMEVLTNVVIKDLTCFANRPKVQFGDSHGMPNRVGRHAFLECSFRRLVPNPAGQHKHFSHISVHLH